jgi:hypothetical protein
VFVALGALVLVLMLTAAVYAGFVGDGERAALIAIVACSYVGFAIVSYRRRIGRAYDQMQALRDEFALTIDERGLHHASERGRSTMPYGDILRIREDERLMLIYQADHLFNMVPKSSPALIEATKLIGELHRRHLAEKRDGA